MHIFFIREKWEEILREGNSIQTCKWLMTLEQWLKSSLKVWWRGVGKSIKD